MMKFQDREKMLILEDFCPFLAELAKKEYRYCPKILYQTFRKKLNERIPKKALPTNIRIGGHEFIGHGQHFWGPV